MVYLPVSTIHVNISKCNEFLQNWLVFSYIAANKNEKPINALRQTMKNKNVPNI